MVENLNKEHLTMNILGEFSKYASQEYDQAKSIVEKGEKQEH